MKRSISKAMRLAKQLQKQKGMTPQNATKKQRNMVSKWADELREVLGVK